MKSNNNLGCKSDKSVLPPFEMPEIWYNDDEIYNLMQTFKRPRIVDPTSYDFKVNFWSSLIQRYAKHNRLLVINEVYLQTIFERVFKSNGVVVRPLCLARVLSHMKNDGLLKSTNYFQSTSITRQMIGSVGWLVTAPIKWSFNHVSSILSYNESTSEDEIEQFIGDHVLIKFINDTVQAFIKLIVSNDRYHLSPQIDAISLDKFNQLLSLLVPHLDSRLFLQDYLVHKRLIEIVPLTNSTAVVKFARALETPLITIGMSKCHKDQVLGLVQLNTLKEKLENDEALMQAKIDELKEEVRRSLRVNKREEAKAYLKRGKILEQQLERKRLQMTNVEHMLVEIETAHDNVQVVDALSAAATTLKAQSIGVDSVHDTMSELGDLIADQQEINASLATIGDIDSKDVTDLEAELAKMLFEDVEIRSQTTPIVFPGVPEESLKESPRVSVAVGKVALAK